METLGLGVSAVGGFFDFDALETGVAVGDHRREDLDPAAEGGSLLEMERVFFARADGGYWRLRHVEDASALNARSEFELTAVLRNWRLHCMFPVIKMLCFACEPDAGGLDDGGEPEGVSLPACV